MGRDLLRFGAAMCLLTAFVGGIRLLSELETDQRHFPIVVLFFGAAAAFFWGLDCWVEWWTGRRR